MAIFGEVLAEDVDHVMRKRAAHEVQRRSRILRN